MPQVFSNGARVELDTSITAEDVSLNIIQGGDLFPVANYAGVDTLSQISPENWFKLVIQDDDGFEVVYCYNHTVGSNTFSNLRRGQEGTIARAFSTGAVVGLRPLAKDMADLVATTKTNKDLLETKADKSGSIEGNAGTATKLESARALSISGGVTAAAKTFDGSMPVDLEVTAIDVSKANQGTLSVERGGTGATTSTGSGSVVLDNSPALAGVPTAPTATKGTNTEQLATTAFVFEGLASKSDSNHNHSVATTDANGFMSSTDKTKLDGISSGATVNSSDSSLRDRSTHTGTQEISTISDLQAALDSKETPAGALAQMRAFGLGAVAGALSSDFNGITQTGFYLGNPATSAASGLPITTVGHNLIHMSGNPATNAYQIAQPVTVVTANACRTFIRQKNGGSWQSWKELALTDSPSFTGTPSTPNLKLSNSASSDVNTLDYYEEGSWTPEIIGETLVGAPTYTNRGGVYTRIGDRVFWTARITLSSKGGMAGAVQVTGLPFTVSSNSQNAGGALVAFFSAMSADIPLVSAIHIASGAGLLMYKKVTGTLGMSRLDSADISNTTYFHIQGQYKV